MEEINQLAAAPDIEVRHPWGFLSDKSSGGIVRSGARHAGRFNVRGDDPDVRPRAVLLCFEIAEFFL